MRLFRNRSCPVNLFVKAHQFFAPARVHIVHLRDAPREMSLEFRMFRPVLRDRTVDGTIVQNRFQNVWFVMKVDRSPPSPSLACAARRFYLASFRLRGKPGLAARIGRTFKEVGFSRRAGN